MSRGIVVRRASAEEVETLFDIRTSVRENHQSREELATLGVTPAAIARMLNGNDAAFVADVEGAAAAFAMVKNDEANIFAVFVRPQHEGKGLGRAVLTAAEDWLWRGGAQEIWLTTGAEPHIRAHGFYAHCGWQRVPELLAGDVKYVKTRPADAPAAATRTDA